MNQILALLLGKELANAIAILRLIVEAQKTGNFSAVADYVYDRFPPAFQEPVFPVTRSEFEEIVNAGVVFVSKVKNSFS
jgi:hypothetical protein